ncbi:MAG: transcriptional repressor NrdR [Phycisphaerales bacterium]|nr:MAG: transcriptional repressor NrdR [Phycisphaerales bacterium]
MRCPACNKHNADKVIDSRSTEGGGVIRRRRACTACGRRFTTKERIEEELRLSVIKRNGARVPYRRDKILAGVRHACYKLPIEPDVLEVLVDKVESDIFRDHDRDVTSERIGEYVVAHLRKLNHVAYVRFMAVYRQFDDVEAFIEEVRDVKERAAIDSPNQQSLFSS